MNDKTHWKKLCNPDYLGAYALEPGQDLTITIKSVANETITGADGKKEECIVARFYEDIKPMILNVTNCKTITKLYNTPYIQEWSGKKIQIYIERVKAFGDLVDALRVRPKIPIVEKDKFTPEHPRWKGAVASLAEETTTIDAIKKKFELSEEDEKKLKEDVFKLAEELNAPKEELSNA